MRMALWRSEEADEWKQSPWVRASQPSGRASEEAGGVQRSKDLNHEMSDIGFSIKNLFGDITTRVSPLMTSFSKGIIVTSSSCSVAVKNEIV